MVFWILGGAVLLSIFGFAFIYKFAMNDKSPDVDPKPESFDEQ